MLNNQLPSGIALAYWGMKFSLTALFMASAISGSLLLVSCGNGTSGNAIKVVKTKGFNPNHGPFDSKGNYVEAWADSPPRRIYVSPDDADLASNQAIASVTPTPIERPIEPIVAYNPQPKPRVYQPKSKPRTSVASKPKSRPKTSTKTRPKRSSAIVVKPKSKPPIIYTVRKGDTLYGLARRYKSGVKTIQIANRLKGTNIRIGQKLKIPRY